MLDPEDYDKLSEILLNGSIHGSLRLDGFNHQLTARHHEHRACGCEASYVFMVARPE